MDFQGHTYIKQKKNALTTIHRKMQFSSVKKQNSPVNTESSAMDVISYFINTLNNVENYALMLNV